MRDESGELSTAVVHASDMKALFFVKDHAGDPTYKKRNEFDSGHPKGGRRIKVVFKDGEVLLGTTVGYHSGRRGFFVHPADSMSNNERRFIVTAATQQVEFI